MRTHFTTAAVAVAILALCAQVGWAQDNDRKQEGERPAAARTQATTVTLPVTGLTEENKAAFVTALQGIGRDVYECAMHPQATSDKPGRCEACGGMELRKRRVAAFTSVAPNVGARSAVLTLAAGETLRLSAITAALAKGPVKADSDRLSLIGNVKLHVAGMSCQGCANGLRTALTGLDEVRTVAIELRSREQGYASLTLANPTGATYGTIRRTVAGTPFRLIDISWTGTAARAAGCCGNCGPNPKPTDCCGQCGGKKVAQATPAPKAGCCGNCPPNPKPTDCCGKCVGQKATTSAVKSDK